MAINITKIISEYKQEPKYILNLKYKGEDETENVVFPVDDFNEWEFEELVSFLMDVKEVSKKRTKPFYESEFMEIFGVRAMCYTMNIGRLNSISPNFYWNNNSDGFLLLEDFSLIYMDNKGDKWETELTKD